ncbi:uncharacterized protein LOC128757519 [Synchiropus splendidus]|uniref:uncharacterized protein LOC128757519 n=1 Tax=Synchiropus splendidus TaxID=270530 RepID=UPI00237D6EAB|nr:uncharacterized protein LOC128757519 [Synchiropus splendidus]
MKQNSHRRSKTATDKRFSQGKEAELFLDLRDEFYLKLVEDFLGPQTGEGLQLSDTPCVNRQLVQVGLMKEENNFPWIAVLEWLVKILPQHWSADFRRLIERATATALSLDHQARNVFLDTSVNFSFVGPICDSISVEREDLLEMRDFSERAQSIEVTNGLILELMNFATRERIAPVVLVSWLQNFNPMFCKNGDTQKAYTYLRPKIKKLKQSYHNHETRSRRRNPAMESLLQSPFELIPIKRDSSRFVLKKRSKRDEMSYKEENEDSEITEGGMFVIKQRASKRSITQAEPDSSDDESSGIPCSPSGDAGTLTLLDIAVLSAQKLSEEHAFVLLKNQYTLSCKERTGLAEFEAKLFSLSSQISLASPLAFLHANANFLAELDDVVMEQILQFELELVESTKEKLGRNKLPDFKNFSSFSESATARYIHMASATLHSDNSVKGRYNNYWVAFCQEKENPTRLEVDHLHRFNSYFRAAAGLIHHHKEVSLFFSDLITLRSHKCQDIILESLSADAGDPYIQCLVCVLALLYCKVVGPYWQLLQSHAEYALYSQNLLGLYQKFLDWSKDCSTLLEPEEEDSNVFLQPAVEEKSFSGIFEYCGMWYTNRDFIRGCLKTLIKKISGVTDKHLKDFLPGGQFSQVPPQELRDALKSCTFSVLTEKYPQFDSISTKTSEYLSDANTSDGSEQVSIQTELSDEDSCGKYPVQRKAKSETAKRKAEADTKQEQIIINPDEDYFTAMVLKNGGPCKTQQDVDKLMLLFDGKSRYEKHVALICEVLYQKKVLNNTSEHLTSLASDASMSKVKEKLKLSLPRARPGYCIVITPITK